MMEAPIRKWTLITLAWFMVGVLYSLQSYHYRSSLGLTIDWLRIAVLDIAYFLFWAVLSPFLFWHFGRWPIEKHNWTNRVPFHVIGCLAVAFLQRGVYEVIFLRWRLPEGTDFTWSRWYAATFGAFDFGVLVCLTLLFIHHSMKYYADLQQESVRAARLESDLAKSQLESLRTQLQPHFLFNALNAVSGLIESQPESARRVIGLLGDLLRYSLEHGPKDEVDLEKELQFSDMFLEIQRVRFGDRLTVRSDVDPGTRSARVPSLLLAPVLENAVQYGIGNTPGPGYIVLSTLKEKDSVVIRVENNVPDESANRGRGFGIGLSNTKARLSWLYGDTYQFAMRVERSRCQVIIKIPYRKTVGEYLP